jgi:HKD family nuclease
MAKSESSPLAGLLGSGPAVVIGLPPQFDLRERLCESSGVKIATAFARMSGWNLIKSAVIGSKGGIEVIAGLNFFQTEPALLESWLKESLQSDRFSCKVVGLNPSFVGTFHPKVLIVQGVREFAVVGSGNMTAGGLCGNVECAVFITDSSVVALLVRWFDDVYRNLAEPLDADAIQRYKPLYAKHRRRNKDFFKEQNKDLRRFARGVAGFREARLRRWKTAVTDGRKFFLVPEFMSGWTKCDKAAGDIRQCLDFSEFNFDIGRWQEFLRIKEFGNLSALNLRKKSFSTKLGRLRAAFRILTDDSRDIRERLRAVLSGKAKVSGIDRNVVSKILAVHDRNLWPIYNSRTDAALKGYGFEMPRGLSKADRYLAYARLMQQFVRETAAKDMYALDRFFLSRLGRQEATTRTKILSSAIP